MNVNKAPPFVRHPLASIDVDPASGIPRERGDKPQADPAPSTATLPRLRDRKCERAAPRGAGTPLMQLAQRVATAARTGPKDQRGMAALLDELAGLRRRYPDDIGASDLAHAMAGLVPRSTLTTREVHEILRRIHALIGQDGFGIRECLRIGASLVHQLPRGENFDLPAGIPLHGELGRTLVAHVFEGLNTVQERALTPEEAGRALAGLLRHEHLFGLGHVRAVVTVLAERTGGEFPRYATALGRHLGGKLSMHRFAILEDFVTVTAGARSAARQQALTAMLTDHTPWPVIVRAAVGFRCRPTAAVVAASFTRELSASHPASARQLRVVRDVLDVEQSPLELARNYIGLANALVHRGELTENMLDDGLLDCVATVALADAMLAEAPSHDRPALLAQLPVLCQTRADADLLLALADRLGRLPELRADAGSDGAEVTTAALVSDLLNAASLRLSARTLEPADDKRAADTAGPQPRARTHHSTPTWINADLRQMLTKRLTTAMAAAAQPAPAARDGAPQAAER